VEEPTRSADLVGDGTTEKCNLPQRVRYAIAVARKQVDTFLNLVLHTTPPALFVESHDWACNRSPVSFSFAISVVDVKDTFAPQSGGGLILLSCFDIFMLHLALFKLLSLSGALQSSLIPPPRVLQQLKEMGTPRPLIHDPSHNPFVIVRLHSTEHVVPIYNQDESLFLDLTESLNILKALSHVLWGQVTVASENYSTNVGRVLCGYINTESLHELTTELSRAKRLCSLVQRRYQVLPNFSP
jgi:hypothetical protein